MNIVYFSEVLGVGGLPNYVIQLANAYQTANPSASVAIAHCSDTVNPSLETAGLRIVRVNDARDIAALNPDIVHVHLLSDNDMIEGLFTLGVPLVRSFHDYTSTCLRRGKRRWPGDRCQRPLNVACAAYGCIISPPRDGNRLPAFADLPAKMAEMESYKSFDAAITGSRHMTGMLLKNGFDPARVHTIPYFSRFAGDALLPRSAQPSTGRLELLFTGQAIKGKGLEILIGSLKDIKGDWHLTVYSEGPRLESAKDLAASLDIGSKISFRGWVNQGALREAYVGADVMIVPSIWDDPGPLVGIEALAMGTPVIGFAVGGIPDYVLDGQTGYLVKDTNEQGLHNAIQTCIDHREKLSAMGIAGKKLVIERHSQIVHLDAMQSIYNSIARNISARRGNGNV